MSKPERQTIALQIPFAPPQVQPEYSREPTPELEFESLIPEPKEESYPVELPSLDPTIWGTSPFTLKCYSLKRPDRPDG